MSPNETLALSNSIIVNPRDFSAKYGCINGKYLFTVRGDDSMKQGHVGTSNFHRSWAQLSLNQPVSLTPFEPGPDAYLDRMTIQVEFVKKSMSNQVPFNTDHMEAVFIESFHDQIFSETQFLVFDFQGVYLRATIVDLDTIDPSHLGRQSPSKKDKSRFGVLTQHTTLSFMKHMDSNIKLTGSMRSNIRANAIIRPDFRFEDMGIGGLDEEFSTIFRRAFASRIFPPSLVDKLGIAHVKGLLLYGPPGTGKTLIARQIGQMLNSREPKIVNGPEILNKYVGQSEENVRNLFRDAEIEYKAKGDDSQLHIIIFDELDAICKQRGSRSDGTGVGDSVVNQMLSKMDGVDSLNNILIIGMTNRLDLIDEALLRPGRLEVQMEIGLPDEQGRLQILKIHTQKMRENNMLEPDVDLALLAKQTPNFSGAEITGLIKSAASFALNRHVKIGTLASVSDETIKDMKIQKEDFEMSLSLSEVSPTFGVSISDIESLMENGFVVYSKTVQTQLDTMYLYLKQIQQNPHTHLMSIFIHGPSGSGKSALASKIAIESGFPFIKLISPDLYIGMNETAKSMAISKIFHDSYKSPHSLILIDDIEKLVEYAPIGPRYSNQVLQTLMILVKKNPPKGRKLFVLVTSSSYDFFHDIGFISDCSTDILIPTINYIEHPLDVYFIVESTRAFNDSEMSHLKDLLLENARQSVAKKEDGTVGIKKLYYLIRMAEESEQKDARTSVLFASLVQNEHSSLFRWSSNE